MSDGLWRVEAYFLHLDKPVVCSTEGKRNAYARVSEWLMSEGIVQIDISHNGKPYQIIKIDDEDEIATNMLLANPESKAALRKLAKKVRHAQTEPGGFDGLPEH